MPRIHDGCGQPSGFPSPSRRDVLKAGATSGLAFLASSVNASAESIRADELEARIAEAAQWELDTKAIPAIAMTIVGHDGPLWSNAWGYADEQREKRIGAGMAFKARPIGQALAAIVVMRLVELGKLDLDAPVRRYVPSFAPSNRSGTLVTLRHLLSHRSGLVREIPRAGQSHDHHDTESRAIAGVNQTELVAEPGTASKYSNAGFAVVEAVVSHVYGKPYADALADLVLRPMGMNATRTQAGPDFPLCYAEMASFDGPRFAAAREGADMIDGNGFCSSVSDLGLLTTALLSRGFIPGGRLIEDASLAAMWTQQGEAHDRDLAFGLGFELGSLAGHRVIGRGGADHGHTTELRFMPDFGIGVIVATAIDAGSSADKLCDFALRCLLAQLRGDSETPEYEISQQIDGAEAERLSGWFTDGEHSVVTRIFDGRLVIDSPTLAGNVRRQGQDFRIEDAQIFDRELRFAPDASWLELHGSKYHRANWPKPPAPSGELASLIGEYGSPENILCIYERDGCACVRIDWTSFEPLKRLSKDRYAFVLASSRYAGEQLYAERDASGEVVAVALSGTRFPRRDFGAEVARQIQASRSGSVDAERAAAMAATPPTEPPPKRPSELVPVHAIDPAIRFDIRYATNNNFIGFPLYDQAAAYMQRPAAEALARADRALRDAGYGLLIFDAYRPWFVTKLFWDAVPPSSRIFVANPAEGSRHNRGCAVDLTAFDIGTGLPLEMTGRFDEFSSRSYSNYVGGTDLERWRRDMLRQAIEREGFSVYPQEWWHFDFKGWGDYPMGNASFAQLQDGGSK